MRGEPCMCGDSRCSVCGSLQGNARCYICGKWGDEGGCINPEKCVKEIIAEDNALAEELRDIDEYVKLWEADKKEIGL